MIIEITCEITVLPDHTLPPKYTMLLRGFLCFRFRTCDRYRRRSRYAIYVIWCERRVQFFASCFSLTLR